MCPKYLTFSFWCEYFNLGPSVEDQTSPTMPLFCIEIWPCVRLTFRGIKLHTNIPSQWLPKDFRVWQSIKQESRREGQDRHEVAQLGLSA